MRHGQRRREPDTLMALVNINNSVAALMRAVTVSNGHLWTIAEYVEWLAWGEEFVEWDSGDEQAVRKLDKNVINRE